MAKPLPEVSTREDKNKDLENPKRSRFLELKVRYDREVKGKVR